MRILFVLAKYYPHIGGVEYVVKSIAERLAKMGHEVTVIAGEPGAERPVEEEVSGVSVIRWPTWSPGDAYHVPKLKSMLEERLTKLVGDVDVVHIHSIHVVLSVWAGLKTRSLGFRGKLVVTPYYHGTGHTAFRRLLWLPWRYNVRRLLAHSDAIITVSKLEAQLVKKRFGLDAIVIENGVDEEVFNFSWSPKDFVMYSGRIERYKNVHRLARVVKILNERYGYSLNLRIYGNGPFKNELTKILEGLGVRFELRDLQSFEKYIETLSSARFFGLISEKESYPQSVNEANAIGVPAIVARPWGENFKDRSRTLVVDLVESDEEIARRISAFLEEAPRQSRSKIPSWDEVTNRYLSIYAGSL